MHKLNFKSNTYENRIMGEIHGKFSSTAIIKQYIVQHIIPLIILFF